MLKLKNCITNSLFPLLRCRSGDQMTGWLIIVLLVVVTGAVFLMLYQGSITELWQGIVSKAKQVFGL